MTKKITSSILAFLLFSLTLSPSSVIAADKLPDLAMSRLRDFSIDTTSIPGKRLLRFASVIVNIGDGPFYITGSRADTGTTDMTNVKQHIFDDGAGRDENIPDASFFYSGDGHNHWHVRDLEKFALRNVNDNPNDPDIRVGVKLGFCFYDNFKYDLTLLGAPQSAVYTSAGGACSYNQAGALSTQMGLSIGWGDKYPSTLVNQIIDITDLPNGKYKLKGIADPKNWFWEKNENNNFHWTDLNINSNNTVTVAKKCPVTTCIP